MKNRLKAIREERKLTLEGLAKMLGDDWALSTLGNVENGVREPSMRLVKRLAEVLRVPARDIVPGWEGDDKIAHPNETEVPALRDMPDNRELVTFIWKGDSMEPKFSTGDQLIASKNEKVEDGDLVVAETEDGTFYFKVFHRMGPNKGKLTSYNPVYPPIDVEIDGLSYIYPVVAVHRVTKSRKRRHDSP